MIARLKRWLVERRKTHGVPRSNLWPHFRQSFLIGHPECAACGTRHSLEVHHVVPFHEDRDSNLITLCEGMNRCHLEIGHHGAWGRINPNVRADAARALASRRAAA